MTGPRCTVAVCSNNYRTSKTSDPKLMFHRFPKDPEIRKIWVQCCRRDGKWNTDTLRVCSAHFTADDYESDLKAKLFGLESKRVLKKTAVPSLNLLPENTTKNENCENNERAENEKLHQNKKLVAELLEETVISCPVFNCEKTEDSISEQNTNDENSIVMLLKRNQNLEEENNLLKINLLNTEKQLKAVQKDLDMEKIINCRLKKQLQRKKRREIPNTMIEKRAIEMLEPLLTKHQLNVLLKKKNTTKWSKEDIGIAFTLRYLSKKAYLYLRKELNFPLPGISTLQRYASKLCLEQGILQDVLRIMKAASYKHTLTERLTVIQFDEMKLKYTYEYDCKKDQIIGPHSQIQVVMARGLISSWKQPIYIDFDAKMTKETLLSIISNLQDIGYPVVACVCDMGGGNLGLWRKIGISNDRSWITNPQNSFKIYFFADTPHLLKLIRNWLLDTGFEANGTIVTIAPIAQLINLDDSELKTCHKLQKKHVNCQGIQRQNVRLAAELLSHSTATALKHYKPINAKLAEDTANFVELVNSWFDIMNSYTQKASIPQKCAYGECLEEQDKVLQEMVTSVTNLKCLGKKNMQQFQKEIIISIKSLQMLYQDLASNYGVKFILTHRLNQDSLKNFFSQLRTRGGLNDHPTPLNALYRIRMIILGKNPGAVFHISNASSWSDDQYLVSTVFTGTGINPHIEDSEVSLIENQDNLCDNSSGSSVVNSSSSEQQHPLSEMEGNGLIYLGRWIACKLIGKYPDLGMPTENSSMDHDYCIPSWVQNLSYGKLYEPTPKFIEQLKQMENIFSSLSFPALSKETGLLKNINDYIGKTLPSIPEDVIGQFTKIRTFIRLKFLNRQIEANQKAARKRSFSSDYQKLKKLKKNY